MNRSPAVIRPFMLLAPAVFLALAAAHMAAPTAARAEATISGTGQAGRPAAGVILAGELRGPITPVTVEYVRRTLEKAGRSDSRLVVFEMDTPGGLVSSTQDIVQSVLGSAVPVAVLVAPSGARAASAGLYIANAADIIAMAPGTRMGAGHPVGPMGGNPGGGNEPEGRNFLGEKIENDLAAWVRSIASQRRRNAAVYERMVRESISLTEREAVDQQVAELIAGDVPELVRLLEGTTVTRFDGATLTLELSGAVIERTAPSLRERILGWIADPQIAFLLMGVGVLGLYVEFNNPGLVVPGVVGVIALALFAWSMQILPVNLLGVLLIALGVSLFVLELKFTSYGFLTLGGVLSLTLGFLTLFDVESMPGLRLSLSFILPTSLTVALLMALVTTVAVRAQRMRVATGPAALQGAIGEAVTDIEVSAGRDDRRHEGKVFVHGEYWNATSTERISAGARITVTSVKDMNLEVKPEGH